MVFTRHSHSVGKIWSSICMQDIEKRGLHYQINLIRLMTHSVYQICLTDKSTENNYMLKTQRRINPSRPDPGQREKNFLMHHKEVWK